LKYQKDSAKQIARCLTEGGVVIFPTETVYSLSCDAENRSAVERIYKIKRRPLHNPFAVLMPNLEMLMSYVKLNDIAIDFINQYSPGPVSYVLPLLDGVKIADNVVKNNSLAIRIPDHKIAQEILIAYGKPVVGTSVNFSSQQSISKADDIPKEILGGVDIIIADDQGVSGVSSTIIDLSSGDIKILRQGEIRINL
jgi:L-threonylcarbamoyladenylate synthase